MMMSEMMDQRARQAISTLRVVWEDLELAILTTRRSSGWLVGESGPLVKNILLGVERYWGPLCPTLCVCVNVHTCECLCE